MSPKLANSLPSQAVQDDEQTLYFAYGSNLSFEQMAKRCPDSRFVGRARLHKYRFQINQRGYANVVRTDDAAAGVEGLCYRLTTTDETKLDRNEGVPTAYQKEELEIELFPASPELIDREVVDIVSHRPSLTRASASVLKSFSISRDDPRQSSEDDSNGQTASSEARLSNAEKLDPGINAQAMVYLSSTYVTPGAPWDEYIERMEMGMQEASLQGVPVAYLLKDVCPWLEHGRG